MKEATGNAVLRAYNRAVKEIQSKSCISGSHTSAGFIIPVGQKRGERKGIQVFVEVARWSEKLMKERPETGGLL
jgi:hypothetical protein